MLNAFGAGGPSRSATSWYRDWETGDTLSDQKLKYELNEIYIPVLIIIHDFIKNGRR